MQEQHRERHRVISHCRHVIFLRFERQPEWTYGLRLQTSVPVVVSDPYYLLQSHRLCRQLCS
ncbi:Uncharacterised protein [Vibrio cholerae]|nr:Uncharacterised protein [Vibrio cholerae]